MGTVYFIKCINDNRIYIGSTNNYNKRSLEHKRDLLKNRHHCIHLQRFVNKYGIGNIYFEIKLVCDNYLEVEQFYLDTVSKKFNTSISATAPMLGKKHSDEFKKWLSKRTTENNPVPKGSKRPQYVIDAMVKGCKGRIIGDEEKKKRYNSLVNKKTVYLINVEDSDGFKTFDSIASCARYIGVSSQSVSFALSTSKSNVKKIYKLSYSI